MAILRALDAPTRKLREVLLLARCGQRQNCSPHALRRTFAVMSLRNGANIFSVQDALGHSNLDMTRRYCRIAQADVQEQHRRFSPMNNIELPVHLDSVGSGGADESESNDDVSEVHQNAAGATMMRDHDARPGCTTRMPQIAAVETQSVNGE